MAIQMIFCVETNKRANTDYIYIKDTIDHFYVTGKQIKINQVYMGAKSRYKAKDVLREIDQKTKDFTIGETKVIYCIDTDEYERNVEHQKQMDNIDRFCEAKGYDLIWFCHDVEDVFIGEQISDSEKVKKAHTSNILNILDKYLPRKKEI